MPPGTPFPPGIFDERIKELEDRVAAALATYQSAQAELEWWRQGRRLFVEGETHAGGRQQEPFGEEARPQQDSRGLSPGGKPTLRSAILRVMLERDGPVRNEDLIESLRERNWLPSGKNALHNVRAKVAELSRQGEVIRVDRGTYRLAHEEIAPPQGQSSLADSSSLPLDHSDSFTDRTMTAPAGEPQQGGDIANGDEP